MDFKAKITDSKLKFTSEAAFLEWQKRQKEEAEFIVSFKKPSRTLRQNNSLHLFFEWIAEALNEKHLYLESEMLKFKSEWTPSMAKELIWRPIQKVLIGEKSTTKLKTNEVSQIAEVIMRNLSVDHSIILNFPDQISKELGIKPFEIT